MQGARRGSGARLASPPKLMRSLAHLRSAAQQTLEVFSEKPPSGFSSVAFPTLLNTARGARGAPSRARAAHAHAARTRAQQLA
jgi:hypothetical protein